MKPAATPFSDSGGPRRILSLCLIPAIPFDVVACLWRVVIFCGALQPFMCDLGDGAEYAGLVADIVHTPSLHAHVLEHLRSFTAHRLSEQRLKRPQHHRLHRPPRES